MDELHCSVCGILLSHEKAKRIGNRYFCKKHFARAVHATRSRWSRAGLIEVGLIVAFVALVGLIGDASSAGTLPTSVTAGLLLALVPAVIWLVYIYRQDRVEPEPWGVVVGVFVLGGILGWGVASPIARDILAVSEWEHLSVVASVVSSVVVWGTLQQFCTYAAVRYTVYMTDEFDEPVDGVVYATAAGLGLATVSNVDFVVKSEGVLPLAGAAFIAITALVHVAAAAVLGYGLGRARFSPRLRHVWLAVSFVVSVLLNGGLKQLAVRAGINQGTFDPWASFSMASVIVAAILLSIDVLTARLSLQSFSRSGAPGEAE